MARRGVRTSRPPYLLVVFIILTVGGATGIGILANLYSKVRLQAAGLQRLEEAVGGVDPVQQLLDEEKAGNLIDLIEKNKKRAVLYRACIEALAKQLAGDPHSDQQDEQLNQSVNSDVESTDTVLNEARARLRESLQMPGAEGASPETGDMRAGLISLTTRVKELDSYLAEKEKMLNDRLAELKQMQEKIRTQSETARKNIDRLQKELADEQARFKEHRQRLIDQNAQFKDEREKLRAQFVEARRAWQRERERLGNEAGELRVQIKELAEMLSKFRVLADEADIDGRIVEVSARRKSAYISLAKGDGIFMGMTFAVYSPDQIGAEKPTPKARARVVRIMDNTSEVRIFNETGLRPVMKDDLVANPVYDRSRRFHFALIGICDIDGDGLDDSTKLRAMIQRFGGAVDEKIAVQTDYLIVGEELPVPVPLGPEATPIQVRIYKKKLQAFLEYSRALVMARDFAIPTLTVNRFLGMVGAGAGG